MTLDFTLKSYQTYLEALKKNKFGFLLFRQFMQHQNDFKKFCLIRHDVDRKPANALKMAELEKSMDIVATYYFRYKPGVFIPEIISKIESMGHEVGYHYENLSDTNGDAEKALADFEEKLSEVRKTAKISTISMHGRPFKPYDNRDLWRDKRNHELLQSKFGILGEVYLDIDYSDIAYITDTGRNWHSTKNNMRDITNSKILANFEIGEQLLQYLQSAQHDKIVFQIHPERWASDNFEWLTQYAKDFLANKIKKGSFMKVLITDAGSYKCMVIARFLKENYAGIEVISTASRYYQQRVKSKYIDAVFIVPQLMQGNTARYVDELERIFKSEKPDLLLPVNSKEIGIILAHKNKFSPALDYTGDYDTYDLLNDKSKLYSLAVQMQVKTPQKYHSIADAQLPFVLKPRISSSSKGVEYVFNEKERQLLVAKISDEEQYIIQQYIKGAGVGYSVFCKNGKIVAGYGHIRLMEYPVSGGSSVYRDSYTNSEMEAIVSKLTASTNWNGFAMFEFKKTEGNEVYLIEVNPRIWGSINQGLQNNCNYFEPLLGKGALAEHYKKSCKTYLSPVIYLAMAGYVCRGDFRPVYLFFKNISENKADINFVNDPLGWLSVFAKLQQQ